MKFRIKANDDWKLTDKISSHFSYEGYDVHYEQDDYLRILTTGNKSAKRVITIYTDIKEVECRYVDVLEDGGLYYGSRAELEKEELKYFDNLGFELTESQMKATNQIIESWF